jgi:hypothetical protein
VRQARPKLDQQTGRWGENYKKGDTYVRKAWQLSTFTNHPDTTAKAGRVAAIMEERPSWAFLPAPCLPTFPTELAPVSETHVHFNISCKQKQKELGKKLLVATNKS